MSRFTTKELAEASISVQDYRTVTSNLKKLNIPVENGTVELTDLLEFCWEQAKSRDGRRFKAKVTPTNSEDVDLADNDELYKLNGVVHITDPTKMKLYQDAAQSYYRNEAFLGNYVSVKSVEEATFKTFNQFRIFISRFQDLVDDRLRNPELSEVAATFVREVQENLYIEMKALLEHYEEHQVDKAEVSRELAELDAKFEEVDEVLGETNQKTTKKGKKSK